MGTMDISFRWGAQYSVGNAVLDAQHANLLDLCERAHLRLNDVSEEGREAFHILLHDLSAYAKTHFRTEEHLLAACGYPRLDEQIAEHTEYILRLSEFLYAATEGKLDREGVQLFLKSWWINHILESDMQFAPFLAG